MRDAAKLLGKSFIATGLASTRARRIWSADARQDFTHPLEPANHRCCRRGHDLRRGIREDNSTSSQNGTLPGVADDYRIAKPAPEPDDAVPSNGNGQFKIGDTDVSISGSIPSKSASARSRPPGDSASAFIAATILRHSSACGGHLKQTAPPLLPQTVGAFLDLKPNLPGVHCRLLISDASRRPADDPTSSL